VRLKIFIFPFCGHASIITNTHNKNPSALDKKKKKIRKQICTLAQWLRYICIIKTCRSILATSHFQIGSNMSSQMLIFVYTKKQQAKFIKFGSLKKIIYQLLEIEDNSISFPGNCLKHLKPSITDKQIGPTWLPCKLCCRSYGAGIVYDTMPVQQYGNSIKFLDTGVTIYNKLLVSCLCVTMVISCKNIKNILMRK
jgi:hypothetical protein